MDFGKHESDNFIVEVYSLAIVLQHDRSFHDVFLDDRSDTNSRVLWTKIKIVKEKLLNARTISNSIANKRVQFVITQIALSLSLLSRQHYYIVSCVTLFRTLLRNAAGTE